jgi:hypothetical protein
MILFRFLFCKINKYINISLFQQLSILLDVTDEQ